KVGGRGQRRPLDGVRPERSERKVLVVRPFGLPRSVQVTGEKRRELPLEGWMEVAVAVVVESMRHGAPPCSASAGHRGLTWDAPLPCPLITSCDRCQPRRG